MRKHKDEKIDFSSVESLIKLTLKKAKQYGADEVYKKLSKMALEQDEVSSPAFNIVVKSVCEHYKITRKHLFELKTRGDYTMARKITVGLLVEYTNINLPELAPMFKRSRQVLYKWVKDCEELDRKNPVDCELFFYHVDIINKKIEKKITQLNLNL